MKRKGQKGGAKSYVVRHRGRRGNFWGDPGKGAPGTCVSRGSMDSLERSIERGTRREGREECEDGHQEYWEDNS